MTSVSICRSAVDAALDSARVDRAAPEGEQVSFDPRALARVVDLFKASGGVPLMKEAWRGAHADTIRGGDRDRWMAAEVLKDRLTGAPDRRYVEQPDGQIVAEGSAAGGSSEAEELARDEEALSWYFPEDHA